MQIESSVSGKYHKPGETLLQHSIDVAKFTTLFIAAYKLNNYYSSILISAALLHDIGKLYSVSTEFKLGWKSYQNGKYYVKFPEYGDHPYWSSLLIYEEACILLDEKEINDTDFDDINLVRSLVKTHMGIWAENMPEAKSFLQRLIYEADYLASRPNVRIE